MKRIYQNIIEQFVYLVKEGKLKVGDKLPSERTLAEMFNVSRASVREAFSAMEIIGLIEVRKGEGTYVSNLNISPFINTIAPLFINNENMETDLLEFRKLIEVEAVKLAAYKSAAVNPAACNPDNQGSQGNSRNSRSSSNLSNSDSLSNPVNSDNTDNKSRSENSDNTNNSGNSNNPGNQAIGKFDEKFSDVQSLNKQFLDDSSIFMDFGEIEECLELMRKAIEEDDMAAGSEADIMFHRCIFNLADNAILKKAAECTAYLLESSVKFNRAKILRNKENTKLLYDQHIEIYEAIKKGDAAEASERMRKHIEQVKEQANVIN